MLSKRYTNLNQLRLIDNAQIFLKHLGTGESIGDGKKGLCGGLTILMIRAFMIGQGEKYLSRLEKIGSASEATLKRYSDIYKCYQRNHRQLIAEKNRLGWKLFIKKRLAYIHNTSVLNMQTHSASMNAGLRTQSEIISQLATTYTINQSMHTSVYNETEISFAREFYQFVNSMLFTQIGFEKTSLLIEDKDANVERPAIQHDITEIIKMIAPDQAQPLEKRYAFGFPLTVNELSYTLEQTIQNGDLVYIYSDESYRSGHAIFLMRLNNEWLLIDPNFDSILHNTLLVNEVSASLKENLFTVFSKKTNNYLPISFHVFRNTPDRKQRPTEEQIIDHILNHRESSDINIATKIGTTAIEIASRSGNSRLVDAVLKHQPTIDSTTLLQAPTSQIFNKMKSKSSFLGRNWKTLLFGTLLIAALTTLMILTAGSAGIPIAAAAFWNSAFGVITALYSGLIIAATIAFSTSILFTEKFFRREKPLLPKTNEPNASLNQTNKNHSYHTLHKINNDIFPIQNRHATECKTSALPTKSDVKKSVDFVHGQTQITPSAEPKISYTYR